MLAEVTARAIGRVTIAEALELTALVARKQPQRYGRFGVRWLCLYLEEHEQATLEDVALLVSNLQSLATREATPRFSPMLRKVARGDSGTGARSARPWRGVLRRKLRREVSAVRYPSLNAVSIEFAEAAFPSNGTWSACSTVRRNE